MKEISDLSFPDNVRYATDHEWVQTGSDTAKIGISDYAQDQLGDIVFVELPQVGDAFAAGDQFGTVESVKAVSELFMPVGGKVLAVNEELEDAPERINNDPYQGGWMIEIRPGDPAEAESLMTADAYVRMLKE